MQKINLLKRGTKSRRISGISTIFPECKKLSSNIDLYSFQTRDIGAIMLEITFESGRLYESKKLVSQACGSLITEGCEELSSAEISEIVDYEGAYLSSYTTSDFIIVKLTSSKKSFIKLLKILTKLLNSPTFSNEELRTYGERRKQKMIINLSKNDVIAYREITEGLYGANSPYGYNSTIEMVDELKSEDLQEHYFRTCTRHSAQFFLSGDFDQTHIDEIDIMSNIIKDKPKTDVSHHQTIIKPSIIEKPGREKQTSLKLGMPLFPRTDDRYAGVYMLNTLLGGYFGSRLMKNIREKRGYTYNIYSMLDTYKYAGSWIISCELDHSNVSNTLEQIDLEFDKLRTMAIPEDELEMVKNYLMGSFMSTINGPFKAINPFKTEILMGLKSSFYEDLFKTVQKLRQEDLLQLANEYLVTENFWKVIVGKA